MSEPMIEISGLRVVFPPDVVVLHDIDLVIQPGEFVVILGRSGGEQQRVAIARALAQAPAVILADEPTASLDPQLTGSIMDILKRINREQRITLVVSQHQLETALAYATRIVGFRRGRLSFDGPPSALTPSLIDAIYGDGEAG